MAAFSKFDQFPEDIGRGVHNLHTGTLRVALTNTAPVATNSVLANITQIGAGNGYTAGGTQTVGQTYIQTTGVGRLICADVVFTAAGGSIGPFRYAVLYNDTPTSPADPLIGFHDYGSALTLADGDTFTWNADPTTGVLTLT